VAKLVDALLSGGSAFGCESSNLFIRTKKAGHLVCFFTFY